MTTQEMPGGVVIEAAPAKINLALHVTGQRADGYHLLDSIVTFTTAGDRLELAPAARDGLELSGRFGPLLQADAADGRDNLVTRARDLLRATLVEAGTKAPPVAITLEKNLPVASGIGGGSADAAAALRGLVRLWKVVLAPEILSALALKLGADVPMCLACRPLRASGIGEALAPLSSMPRFALVLANPLKAVSTPEIFRRLAAKDNPPIDGRADDATAPGWTAWLSTLRNDLEPAAQALLPEIAETAALLTESGASFVRMSGSGATCFGLYGDLAAARRAADALSQRKPDWYFAATETIAGEQA